MIDNYEFGTITIDGIEYNSDVIVYPNHIDSNWWRKEGHSLYIEDIEEVIKEKPEILIVGTGYYGCVNVLKETQKYLESQNITLISENTQKACQIYNELFSKYKVIAALHLTC